MRVTYRIPLLSAILILATQVVGFAATVDPRDKSPEYNYGLIGLVSLVVILLFVIGMLAGILRQLGLAVKDKNLLEKNEKGTKTRTILSLLALFLLPAFTTSAAEAAEAAPAAAMMISGIPAADFYLVAGVIILELVVIFALVIFINMLLRVIRNIPEAVAAPEEKKSWFWDKFNAAASMEKERDILLDHNYDGIQELDNSLPPWWKYGFYLTIVVGIIYFYRFHISHGGMSQQEEFVAEMQKGEEDKAAYLATSANNVDESNVVMLTGAAELAHGKEQYVRMCAACHLADGGGSVGPNLTDDYWMHGGSIKDIFKSIKYGWQDKGMKSWKDDFSPKEIQELASYIKTLKGTKPATAKEAQGDLFIEATEVNNGETSAKTDSVKAG